MASNEPPAPVALGVPGLVKAIWAFVAALAAVAAAIFWAGYNWASLETKWKKIDELDKKFSYLQFLSEDEKKYKAGRFGGGTAPVSCERGYVVVGVQLGSENLAVRCAQLVP